MVNMGEWLYGTKKRTRSLTEGDKNYLFIKVAKGKCEYCKKDLVSEGITQNIHHIVEFARSRGSDDYNNLIVLCPDCHSRVHNDQISKEALRAKIAYRLPKKASGGSAVTSAVVPKKAAPKKTTAKIATARKTTPKKTTAKIATARKTTPKKTAAKKTTAKKTTPKKTTAKKTTAKKTTPKETTAKKRS